MVQGCSQGCVFIDQEPGKGKADPGELEVLGTSSREKEEPGKECVCADLKI